MDIEPGNIFTDDFIIRKITKKRKTAELTLEKDGTEIRGIVKSNLDLFLRSYKEEDHIICQGKVRKRGDELHLDIAQLRRYDLGEDAPQPDFDFQKYLTRFEEIVNSVEDPDYKMILEAFFQEEQIKEQFLEAPAARGNHHAYSSGLLQHTVETTDVAISIAQYYGDVDTDLLVTACLLHDIGKLRSYEMTDKQIERTDWDELIGHTCISALFISKFVSDLKINPDKIKMLYHLVLAHHGRKEWGSPVEMKMKEAVILNHADGLSSYLNHIGNLSFNGNWSEFDKLNNRKWFKGN